MLRIGGANEMVVIDTELGPLADELGRHLGGVRQRVDARGRRGALHFEAVLIRSRGQDHRIVALHFLEALDQVRGKRGVSGAQMRRRVDVVDGSGQVIFHREFFKYARFASAKICLSGTPDSRASLRQSSYSGANDPFSAIFIRTVPCGVETSTECRALTRRSAELNRSPSVDVSSKIRRARFSRSSGRAITLSSVPGRLFFI